MSVVEDNLEEDSEEEVGPGYNWFILRVIRDEEACISQIKDHIAMRKLQDRITDIKYLKEHIVTESEEFDPHSEFLPKRGFKSTPTSIWVRIANGNYKRIRLVVRKPFRGMIFIKMDFDPELFKMIRSWDSGYAFLGSPLPSSMSESQLQSTEASLSNEVPDLLEYAKEKGYQVVEGSRIKLKTMDRVFEEFDNTRHEEEEKPLDFDEPPRPLTPEEEKEAKKAKIYSELNIKDYGVPENNAAPKVKTKRGKDELRVNDFVFIKHLGFKGIIQEIDLATDKVVVGVQMFGRKQPVECKASEVTVIYN